MFESIYTSLSGMLGFSKGLDVISNNVANLNTPGFKSSQLQFQDLYYQYSMEGNNASALQVGTGVNPGNTSLNFAPGQFSNTGNDTDVAIDGNGFFILRKDGQISYSRVGQFTFDENGFLVARSDKARVAGLASSATGSASSGIYSGGGGIAGSANAGNLQDINISGFRTSPALATTEVKFVGNLSTGAPSHQITGLVVYDSSGASHTLTITFTNNSTPTTNNSTGTPGSWLVDVTDETNAALLTKGEVRFGGDGSPETNFNKLTFSYAPKGALATTVSFNFGDPGSFSGATAFSGGTSTTSSTLKMASQNGYAAGSLTKTTFDADGNLVATYSNGQSNKVGRLALAWFNDLQGLQQTGGNLFVNNTTQEPRLAHPGEDVMGKLVPNSIELSNVQLTQEFTDMIIIQRGYQGNSQIISVANEMIQQLLDLRKA
ncbi:MAG TPA: flagellar basal-body rod protein FlgF [Acidiferrobacterales bacterium]|nr:flagellar basal-body rod protein FlgF [Acidiferrobacterales bacterium]